MKKLKTACRFVRSLVVCMAMVISWSLAPAFGQESVFDLPWTVGEADIAVPHAPFSISISETQAMVTGADALDFERIGTGGFAFRAPAVLVNLNENQGILDNVYIQYYDVGYVSLDDWKNAPRPHVLAASISAKLLQSGKGKGEKASFRFSKWRNIPYLDRDTSTIYYAHEIVLGDGVHWVNAKAIQLTRRGYAAISWIGTPAIFESAAESLEGIISNLTLDEGAAYADFDKNTDKLAIVGSAALLDQLHSGQNVTVGGAGVNWVTSGLESVKQFAWLLLLPVAGVLVWMLRRKYKKRRAKRDAAINDPSILGIAEGDRIDPKASWYRLSFWLSLVVVSFLLSALMALVFIEMRGSAPFPDADDLDSIEGIVWQVDKADASVTITLMGTERSFNYRRVHGGQVKAVRDAAIQSYNKGSRVTLYYDPVSISADLDEPITVLGFKAGDTVIVSLEQSKGGAAQAQRLALITGGVFLLVFMVALFASYYVFFRRFSNRYPKIRFQLVAHAVVALPCLAAFIVLSVRLYDVEMRLWVDRQIERAQTALSDDDSAKTIEIVEATFDRTTPTDQQQADLMRHKADGLQVIGFRSEDDALLLQSIEAYDVVLSYHPKDATVLSQLGYSFVYMGAYREAVRAFERMGDEGSTYWSLIRQASVHRTLGRYSDASDLYEQAYDLTDNWNGMPLNYHRAKNFILMGRPADAVEAIDLGLEYQKDYPWAFVYRGCAKVNMGDYEGAAADYRSAMQFIWASQKDDGVPLDFENLYPEQKIAAETVDAFSRGIIGSHAPVSTGIDFCDQHTSIQDRERDRSELLPPSFDRPYLMTELELKADSGDGDAMFELAVEYAEFDDDFLAPSNLIKYWFNRSAEEGNAWSMNELGLMYQNGTYDTEIDYVKSVPFFRRAAELGDEMALYNLAHAYRDGLGVEPDAIEATGLLIQSAGKGYNAAQYEAALRLSLGRGIDVDNTRAEELFTSAGNNEFRADDYLICDFGVEGLFTELRVSSLFDHYRANLTDASDGTAMQMWHEQVYGLAQSVGAKADLLVLLNGQEISQLFVRDLKNEVSGMKPQVYAAEAAQARFKLLRVAAEHGNRAAQADLAAAFEVGDGTAINPEAALYWRQLSVAPVSKQRGISGAQSNINKDWPIVPIKNRH